MYGATNPLHRRQHRPAGAEEVARRPQGDGGIEKQAKLPPPGVEGEEQQRRQRQRAVERVPEPGALRHMAAQHPKKVIQESQRGPQAHRQAKLRRVQRYRLLHQPNSRERKPPEAGFSSS